MLSRRKPFTDDLPKQNPLLLFAIVGRAELQRGIQVICLSDRLHVYHGL